MNRLRKFVQKPLVQAFLFWLISFVVLLNLFSQTGTIRFIDIIYTALFHIPLLVGVWFNQLFMREFLDANNIKAYLASYLISVPFVIQIYPLTFDLLAPFLFPNFYFIKVYEWYEMAGIGFIYIGFATLLHLAKSWFAQQENLTKLARLEEQNIQSELQALRAQINPHFLFNTLNTIYYEALKKSAKAPRLILKLSDILRYIVDNMEKERVPVEQELAYLTNFVELHKERLDHPERVTLSIQGNTEGKSIAPLLLIIFIENCFVHGDVSDENGKISISILTHGNTLVMKCQNTFSPKKSSTSTTSKVGLQNARRRLDLSYENRYQLKTDQTGTLYNTQLTLKLD